MKVILKTDVVKLGRVGDVKEVARGYARNYLFARGLATGATGAALRSFERGREKRLQLREKADAQARAVCKKIEGITIAFTRPVGEQGKLFGSVGKSDILKGLKAAGYALDKNAVILEAALKTAGEHEVEIRPLADAAAKIKVSILPRS